MSVSSIYLAVEWQQFLQAAQASSPEECLDVAQENEEPWIRPFPFGRKVDRYIFESQNAVSEFDDWFREIRKRLPAPRAGATESFRTVFLDFGLLHDDVTLKLKPINRLAEPIPKGEWLMAAMSPEDVRLLCDRAAVIDRRELGKWFDAALALKACRLLESGPTAAAWLDALTAGLDDTARKREGIAVGMA